MEREAHGGGWYQVFDLFDSCNLGDLFHIQDIGNYESKCCMTIQVSVLNLI